MSSKNSQKSRGRSRPNQIPEPAAGGSSSYTPNSPWMFKLLIISPKAPDSRCLRSLAGHHLMAGVRRGRVLFKMRLYGLFDTN